MTTYYVRKTGSDAAAGTSAGAAWLTVGKALGASGISSGDTCWVGAGVYRELVAVAMTSATAETFVLGDVDGVMTGDAGEVRLTAWLTNDTTASSAGHVLNLKGRDFLTFRNLHIVGRNAPSAANTAVCLEQFGGSSSTNITFTDCTIRGYFYGGGMVAYNVPANLLVDRCIFISDGSMIEIGGTLGAADYDVGITFQNSLMLSAGQGDVFVIFDSIGGGAGKPGGLKLLNCTLIGGSRVLVTGTSTATPMLVHNCHLFGAYLQAAVSGQIVEDYNSFSYSANVNVTAGTNSKFVYAPLFHIGEELQWGGQLRPYGSPSAGSPLLGFGGTSPPSVDILNGPRPAGGASSLTAVGAYERGNTFGKETGTVRSGANAISIIGPGYQDWYVRVAAVSTTITVWVRWDGTYTGTKPKLQVLGGTECGVADATDTATGSSGAWEELSLTFTPTSAGVVRIRFLSSDTNGGGEMIVDDFLRTP